MMLWGSPRKPSFEHGASDAEMLEGWMVYWMNVEYTQWLRHKTSEWHEEDKQIEKDREKEVEGMWGYILEHIKRLHEAEDDKRQKEQAGMRKAKRQKLREHFQDAWNAVSEPMFLA